MNLEALRSFLAVVETGSILAASERLNLPRATLRRRIEELEATVGTPLLTRSPQGARVTEAGAVVVEQGRNIVKEMEALLCSVRGSAADPTGTVRIMLPVGLPPRILTLLLQAMRKLYPRLTVQLVFASPPMSAFPDHVDAVISLGMPQNEGSWKAHECLRFRERLLASPGYLERAGTPTTIKELEHHTLLSWEGPDANPHIWPTLNGSSFRVEPALISADIHFLRHCLANGLGIGLVPDPGLRGDDVSHELVPVLAHCVGRERAAYLVVPGALSQLPKIKALIELAELLSGAPGLRFEERLVQLL